MPDESGVYGSPCLEDGRTIVPPGEIPPATPKRTLRDDSKRCGQAKARNNGKGEPKASLQRTRSF